MIKDQSWFYTLRLHLHYPQLASRFAAFVLLMFALTTTLLYMLIQWKTDWYGYDTLGAVLKPMGILFLAMIDLALLSVCILFLRNSLCHKLG